MVLRGMTDSELNEITGQAGIDLMGALNTGLPIGTKLQLPSEVNYTNLYDLVVSHLDKLNELNPASMFILFENMISIIAAGGLTNMTGIEIGPILEKVVNFNKDLLVNYLKDRGIGTLTFKNYEIHANGVIDIKIRI